MKLHNAVGMKCRVSIVAIAKIVTRIEKVDAESVVQGKIVVYERVVKLGSHFVFLHES